MYTMEKLSNKKKNDMWQRMRTRCYDAEWQKKYGKHYIGHTVCKEWLTDKNAFYKWVDDHYYQIHGTQMDLDHNIKDLNNTVYSPDKCLFVPHDVNAFYETLRVGKYSIKQTQDGRYKVKVESIIWKGRSDLKILDSLFGEFMCDSWNDALSQFCVKKTLINELYLYKYQGRIPREVYDAMCNLNVVALNAHLYHWDEPGTPTIYSHIA